MNLNQILSKTLRTINKHSTLILSIFSGACTIGAVVSTADATSKTLSRVGEMREEEMLKIAERIKAQGREPDISQILDTTKDDEYKLTTKETVKYWALPVCLSVAAITGIIFNHKLNAKKQAALIAAAASMGQMYNTYRNATIDIYGKEADEEIVRHIIESKPDWTFNVADDFRDYYKIGPDETVTFYDENVGGYFETTPYQVLQAMYHLNRVIQSEGYITLTKWYDFLGVEPDFKHKNYCDTYGWDDQSMAECCEFFWFDMGLRQQRLEDGMTVYEFVPLFDAVYLVGEYI